MLHPGPPQYSIGQEIEITDDIGQFGFTCYISDVWHNPETNITSYLFSDKPFFAPDLNDLFNTDNNRD
jgi:hypothetical protein